MNHEIVTYGDIGPEAGVEHPVGVGCEGEAVVGIVVAADGMLVDVGGLDDRGMQERCAEAKSEAESGPAFTCDMGGYAVRDGALRDASEADPFRDATKRVFSITMVSVLYPESEDDSPQQNARNTKIRIDGDTSIHRQGGIDHDLKPSQVFLLRSLRSFAVNVILLSSFTRPARLINVRPRLG